MILGLLAFAAANFRRDTNVPGTDILEAEIASFGELKLWSGPASSVTRVKQKCCKGRGVCAAAIV